MAASRGVWGAAGCERGVDGGVLIRGKRVAAVPAAAYGGYKDVSEAWAAGVFAA